MIETEVISPQINQVWRHKHTQMEYYIKDIEETIFGPAEVFLVSLKSNFETGLDFADLIEKFEYVRDVETKKARRRV
jgi:hypothetical protein